MRRARRAAKAAAPVDSSDDDEPLAKKINRAESTKTKPKLNNDDSSSESDIESYLQPIDKIDLSSSFFAVQTKDNHMQLENGKPSETSKLTDSDSDGEAEAQVETRSQEATSTKLNFQQLHDYTAKIEEARKHVEQYNARKQAAQESNTDIFNMLVSTENKSSGEQISLDDLHSSDFESCSDSEKEGWEEVKNKESSQKEKTAIPKEGLQITVEMPSTVRKKKGTDLFMAMKRRLNRIKKENQVLIHKVHLLCWLAHGNYVNSILNGQVILALSLSLLPSEKCYPEGRTDLKYLEQILQWYRKAVTNGGKQVDSSVSLDTLLHTQIKNKEVFNKNMWVYVFVSILRAIGVQCRLVLSFQVEPIRPPSSELCSLSTKTEDAAGKQAAKKATKGKNNPKKSTDVESPSKKIKLEANTQLEQEQDGVIKNSTKTQAQKATKKVQSKSIKSENKTIDKSEKSINKAVATRSKTEDKTTRSRPKSTSNRENKSESTRKTTIDKDKNIEDKTGDSKKRSTRKTADKSEPASTKPSTTKQSATKRHKSTNAVEPTKSNDNKSKSAVKNTQLKVKWSVKERTKGASQMDGTVDSSSEDSVFESIPQLDGPSDTKTKPKKPNLKKLQEEPAACPIKVHPKRSRLSLPKYKDTDSEDDFTPRHPLTRKNSIDQSPAPKKSGPNLSKLSIKTSTSRSPNKKSLDVRNDIIQLVKGAVKQQKEIYASKLVKNKRKSKNDSEGDSDYVPEVMQKKRHDSDDDFAPVSPTKQSRTKVSRKVISSDSDNDKGEKKRKGNDVWAEVFLETEEKWICVDVVHGQIHCANELYKRATHPVSYVVAWNNNNTIRDVTARYCQNFNTVTRKLRIDAGWWEESTKPFIGKKTARDKEEDEEFEQQQLEKPLPTSITEYKNHPLYVLQRHLLKFQAIYPPNAPPLGYVRKEAVYSRQCVYTLHSRDIWLKHAKVVKLGEKPYKIVKARPKYDKLSNTVITDQLLEIFGPWQTQDYEPPTAENGVVPRNAFGNVELFKACMLPKKTVHLKLPGLNKIARRMDIDCAPALVGFDFHSGWSHPSFDGFVVCEEYEDTLIAAWELEQDEIEKRELEKVEKRVYTNWKKLIRGLLIRERLKVKYDFGGPSGAGGKEKKKKPPRLLTKKRRVYSDSGSESDKH